MDGSKVWEAFQAGKLAEIRNYCETDVMNTWLVYCRFQLMRCCLSQAEYDGEIAFTDAIIADVLEKLRAHGLLDHTIVAVIGDHGESLGDHGEETHSMFVYDAAIRVPFILWRPGRIPAGLVVRDPVRGIDAEAGVPENGVDANRVVGAARYDNALHPVGVDRIALY